MTGAINALSDSLLDAANKARLINLFSRLAKCVGREVFLELDRRQARSTAATDHDQQHEAVVASTIVTRSAIVTAPSHPPSANPTPTHHPRCEAALKKPSAVGLDQIMALYSKLEASEKIGRAKVSGRPSRRRARRPPQCAAGAN